MSSSLAECAFREYGTALHRYLMRRLMNAQDARDLVQDAYVRLAKVKDAALVRQPQAYLFRIASNLVYEWAMRKGRDPVIFDSRMTDSAASRVSDPCNRDPDEILTCRQQVESLISSLPPLYAAILVMKKRDGLTLAEIAGELDLSIHTVKKYLTRAIAQCRAHAARLEEESMTRDTTDLSHLYRRKLRSVGRSRMPVVYIEADDCPDARMRVASALSAIERRPIRDFDKLIDEVRSARECMMERDRPGDALCLFELKTCGFMAVEQPLFLLREPAALIHKWVERLEQSDENGLRP